MRPCPCSSRPASSSGRRGFRAATPRCRPCGFRPWPTCPSLPASFRYQPVAELADALDPIVQVLHVRLHVVDDHAQRLLGVGPLRRAVELRRQGVGRYEIRRDRQKLAEHPHPKGRKADCPAPRENDAPARVDMERRGYIQGMPAQGAMVGRRDGHDGTPGFPTGAHVRPLPTRHEMPLAHVTSRVQVSPSCDVKSSNSAPRLSSPPITLSSWKFSFKNATYLSRGAHSPPGRLAADAPSFCQTAVVRGRQRARETKTLGVAMAAISFADRVVVSRRPWCQPEAVVAGRVSDGPSRSGCARVQLSGCSRGGPAARMGGMDKWPPPSDPEQDRREERRMHYLAAGA